MKLSANITQTLRENNYQAVAFDPRTGLPIDSLAGSLRLDDVAVVQSLLGYAIDRAGECAVILHPDWGKAVYPSILLSSATPQTLSLAVQNGVAPIQPIASL